jgi:hypothetical protein
MSTLSAHPQASSFAGDPAGAARSARGRGARVMIFLSALWALNLLDLLFTVLAVQIAEFIEMNPLAKGLGPAGLIALKLALLAVCSTIFIALRRRRCVEWGCYLLLAVYGGLAVVWLTQYRFLLSPSQFSLLLSGR